MGRPTGKKIPRKKRANPQVLAGTRGLPALWAVEESARRAAERRERIIEVHGIRKPKGRYTSDVPGYAGGSSESGVLTRNKKGTTGQ